MMPENRINDEKLEEVSGGRWIIKGKKTYWNSNYYWVMAKDAIQGLNRS